MADISLRQMAASIAAIDARTANIDQNLDALIRMTARAPDGRTLINLVATILADVQH
jgi:hypothetical protein